MALILKLNNQRAYKCQKCSENNYGLQQILHFKNSL